MAAVVSPSLPPPSTRVTPSTSSASPPVPLVGGVRLVARGLASSILVLADVPPLLTAYSIGQMFAAYGRLRVNVVLSQSTKLTAVLQFAEASGAHFAHAALHGRAIQLEAGPTETNDGTEQKEAKEEDDHALQQTVRVQRYVFDIRFAEEPLFISLFKPAQLQADLKGQLATS